MKKLLGSALLLFAFSLNAQAPTAVPVGKEPHHRLVFENSYVHVFRVSVPAHDATLLHQHDVPYVYVALGPADVINAVAGKPEVRLVMADGQVGYSRGGFAHIARNDSDIPFNNVTVELLKPQGEPRNLCEKIVDGPLANCPQAASSPAAKALSKLFQGKRLFETDDVLTDSVALTTNFADAPAGARRPRLLIACDKAELRVGLPGESPRSLQGGEVLWLSSGVTAKVSNLLERGASHYLVLTFKDEDDRKKP
jgi:hypothetical protein